MPCYEKTRPSEDKLIIYDIYIDESMNAAGHVKVPLAAFYLTFKDLERLQDSIHVFVLNLEKKNN